MARSLWSRRVRDRVFAVVFVALVVLTAIAMTWVFRQGYAVHRLTRGVGDTWFLSADGRRWFRMDEHHQDVPLADIPVHLQQAFIAVEDHRFYSASRRRPDCPRPRRRPQPPRVGDASRAGAR